MDESITDDVMRITRTRNTESGFVGGDGFPLDIFLKIARTNRMNVTIRPAMAIRKVY
jgi:hypothetical protein